MRNRLVLSLILIGVGSPVPGAQSAPGAPPPEGAVRFRSGAEIAHGLVFRPTGRGPFPAVLVVQERGVDEWIKDRARALAQQGYLALAVDLYRGNVTRDPTEAHPYMTGLTSDRALRDLRAAVSYLRGRSDVRSARVAAVGWSTGGRYVLDLATEEPFLAAVAVYYGELPTDPAAIRRIRAPVLGHFGGDDQEPAPDQVKAFVAAMRQAGKDVDVKVYEGAPHAFANRDNPGGGYREAAAKDAWARTVAFLGESLKR